jgi:hypothetical protein
MTRFTNEQGRLIVIGVVAESDRVTLSMTGPQSTAEWVLTPQEARVLSSELLRELSAEP